MQTVIDIFYGFSRLFSNPDNFLSFNRLPEKTSDDENLGFHSLPRV